ncbi:MAG: hypothetical protein JSW20_12690 [Nitrospiraceae bacterium]|nr:MAG: hypothetical protein JSW20_12690 [Nitrospiraceae bacterium]
MIFACPGIGMAQQFLDLVRSLYVTLLLKLGRCAVSARLIDRDVWHSGCLTGILPYAIQPSPLEWFTVKGKDEIIILLIFHMIHQALP